MVYYTDSCLLQTSLLHWWLFITLNVVYYRLVYNYYTDGCLLQNGLLCQQLFITNLFNNTQYTEGCLLQTGLSQFTFVLQTCLILHWWLFITDLFITLAVVYYRLAYYTDGCLLQTGLLHCWLFISDWLITLKVVTN